ncbi:MAG: DUF5615 family PIN-like protein [Nitrospinae bacterium]|nr:DUF5615 family PIN-like protein [Nitrospinota bacterium]
MKFLVDNALSPIVSHGLTKAGFDCVHVRDIGLAHADDASILSHADSEGRIIISSDADFGALLAMWGKSKPSVIIFRSGAEKKPENQLALLIANLSSIRAALEEGCLVVIEPARLRIRKLPILG